MGRTAMDMWLYYDVTHARHVFCNPISEAKVDELGRVLELGPASRVLDIACGHAEFLVRWHEQHGISGVGVDLSPYAVRRAEKRRKERVPDAGIEILHMGGADYEAKEPFDVAMCIGASWIWDGFEGTLEALRSLVEPGGLVVSGEPYWMGEPPAEYLEADEITREQFFTLEGCRQVAIGRGLSVVWMIASSLEDWDRYEMDQSRAMDRFARDQPDHPDLGELRALRGKHEHNYLRWGRHLLGFALWVFRANTVP